MSLDSFFDTYEFVIKQLKKEADLEGMSSYEELATKTLFIAAAGDLERRIIKVLTQMSSQNGSPIFISEFISNQALKRKYHTLFSWESKNVNSFCRLFGNETSSVMQAEFNGKDYIRDFLLIGSERNRIVHNGLATESISHTFVEVKEFYLSSLNFPMELKKILYPAP